MNILIIEDELLIQKSLKKFMEKRGMNVDTTASGIEGLNLIHSNNYDRIICDLMLQDITGFDILEDSKKIYDLKQISKKFIIITAYSSESVQIKAKEYGCTIINKPFTDISSVINQMLES